jgi:hypothetical protein
MLRWSEDELGINVEFTTVASVDEASAYYRKLLKDKDDFNEKDPSTFHCRTSDWDVNISIRKVVKHVSVLVELYTLK